MQENARRDIWADYFFNEEEKKALSKNLANKNLELQSVDNERKASASAFKSRMDSLSADINLTATHISQGKKQKQYPCKLKYDLPNRNRLWLDVNTGELIMTEKMEAEDFQQEFPNDNPNRDTAQDEQQIEERGQTVDAGSVDQEYSERDDL